MSLDERFWSGRGVADGPLGLAGAVVGAREGRWDVTILDNEHDGESSSSWLVACGFVVGGAKWFDHVLILRI
jgi:hypothetical protein